MKKIGGIGNEDLQSIKVTKFDGTQYELILNFRFATNCWYMTVIDRAVVIKNIKVVTCPNLLRQFDSYFDFGIACLTENLVDPRFIDDFLFERSVLYTLTPEDVLSYEESLANG